MRPALRCRRSRLSLSAIEMRSPVYSMMRVFLLMPDRVYTLFVHQLPPPVTRLPGNFHCVNGRAYAGNTPTITARVGQDVEIHAFGMDSNFHTFHIHGHRWRDPAGAFIDNPAMGPNESVTARFVEDNPGRWMYHCHVFSHQDAGMAGWYVVE